MACHPARPRFLRVHSPYAYVLTSASLIQLAPSDAAAERAVRLGVQTEGVGLADGKISADGRTVGFFSFFSLPSADLAQFLRPDASNAKVLQLQGRASPMGSSLSADGTVFAYVAFTNNGPHEIRVVHVPSSVEILVSGADGGATPAVSGDGSTVAFESFAYFFVNAVDADSSNLRNVSGILQAVENGPSITSTGDLVVFEADVNEPTPGPEPGTQRNQHIFLAAADGPSVTQLTDDPTLRDIRPRISADGTRILFERSPASGPLLADLWLMDADGGNLRQLTSGPPIGFWGEAHDLSALSGDGTMAAFGAKERAVFVVHTDGTGLRQIGHAKGRGGIPEVSIDGRGSVVVHSVRRGDGIGEVWAVGVPGVVPNELADLELDADAQTLAWASTPSANAHNLYRAALTSSGSPLAFGLRRG